MTRRTFLLPLLLTALCLLAGASTARAQGGDHRAALVVRFADNSVETRCVAFSEPSITGAELLTRSGLQIIGSGEGAVCSIAGAGCAFPTQDCFCRCQGLTCEYWAYYHWAGSWQYSEVGAGGYQVTNGALEGWSWGAGNWSSGVEPPVVAFDEVCAPPATATPTATVTATPTATATATPTATVKPLQDQTPPQVTFEAQPPELTPGACTTLRWWVSDATQLTLDGTPVNAQEQRQICPPTTQRLVLTAANAAGQTVREITVRVSGSSPTPMTVQPASSATRTPIASAVETRSATPNLGTAKISTVTPDLPTATPAIPPAAAAQPAPPPEPPLLGLAGIAVAHAQEIAPTAAPNSQISHGLSSETVSLLVARATSTPRPRRQLGADGRPTPTPILLAYMKPVDTSGTRSDARTQSLGGDSTASAFEAPSRDFSLAFLPGYAAYLLTLASLVGAGVWVVRRKSGALRKS
jgi:hypothetical protein